MIHNGGTACSIDPNWNTQLVSYYTDTVGVVDFPDMFRMSFDGVILHPYYAAKNYETYINTPENTSIPISQLNAEIGTTGFGYDCIDPLDPLDGGKWRYDIYDERLRGAFDGDADGIGIRTNFKNFMKLEYRNTYDLYNDVLHFEYSPGLVQGGKWLWTTEWNIKDEDRDESNYNNKLIGVYTNSFMHALLMQEWWLKNLKLNFQSGYRKNFFLFSTLQNYAGGAGKDMLTLADNSELLDLGLSPSTAYYTKRAPYQAMLLLSEITEQNLKYLPSTYGLPAIDVNLQPTSFIDPLKENIYVYYTNVTASAINYKLNTDNLTAFFPGSDFVDPGVATIYSLQADKNYSTVGRSTLFDINECYDGATYMEDAQHPWDMQALELPYFNTPECTGTFDPDKCITVEPYSIGYFRVPIVPHYPRLMPENILYSEAPGDIQLYPNPASSFFAFTINEEAQDEIYTLEILNIEGAKLLEIKAVTGKPVDISQLPNGIYTVVINNSCFKKLVKS
ncbi:MAG: T9SS type A sorting domain-containing protein [Chitinophagales bacterium]